MGLQSGHLQALTRREGTPNCLVRWGQKQARMGNGVVACTQHVEMGTVVLLPAKGRDNAQGPSNQHMWAPLGEQEQLKYPSAHEYDISIPNPCLIRLQQNRYQIK